MVLEMHSLEASSGDSPEEAQGITWQEMGRYVSMSVCLSSVSPVLSTNQAQVQILRSDEIGHI